jgi:hypothetical protein
MVGHRTALPWGGSSRRRSWIVLGLYFFLRSPLFTDSTT